MFNKLWMDECGAIISAELVLVSTILVIGMVVGLTTLRNAIVTELADLSAAIRALDQTYSIAGVAVAGVNTVTFTRGSQWIDPMTGSDAALRQVTGLSMGISVTEPPQFEGALVGP